MNTKALLLLPIIAILFSTNVYAQDGNRNADNFSQEKFDNQIKHFLDKSKKQKKLAWILLGSGTALSIISSAIVDDNYTGYASGYQVVSSLGSLATLSSIPLFFSASNNKNKSQLVYYAKMISTASSDSLKKIYLEDASEYFASKARGNTTTGIILSAIGGVFIVSGLTYSSNNNGFFFGDGFARVLLVLSGISFTGASIPFYLRGSNLKRTSNSILKSGRIPMAYYGSITPMVSVGKYVGLGVRVQF